MNDMTSAFQALFANARTPADQAAIRQRYAESMLAQQGEDRNMLREDRSFAQREPSRQFDERSNLLRMIFGGGGMGAAPASPTYGEGDGWQGGRFTGATAPSVGGMGGMGMPVSAPDPMRKSLDNYLAQLLGRR